MRLILPTIFCITVLTGLTMSAADRVFYVSPSGNDAWSGLLAEAGDNDGPFLTLARAQRAVRETRKRAPASAVTVEIRKGTYYLSEPLTFGLEDGGGAGAPVIYRAFGDEKAVICGGRVLSGWQESRLPNGTTAWTVSLPEVKAGNWAFCQLFLQDRDSGTLERRYRPCRGMFAIAGLTYAPAKKAMRHRAAQDEFRFFSGDFEQWKNLGDVEVLALHCWSASRLLIRDLDLKHNVVAFTGYPTFRIGHWWKDQRNPYYVENVKEDLDAPGEWYLDRPTGVLTYIPMEGETLANSRMIAPVHEQLIRVQGDADAGQGVDNLHFQGLTFAVSQWNVPPKGYGGSQAMPDLRAAIEFEYARECSLERCTIAHTGAYGMSLGVGCQENRLVGLTMYDLGGGGIKVGNMGMKRDAEPPVVPVGNVIENNLIMNGGVMHFSANAIWGGIVKDTVIRHNEIRHFPYSGIAVGWCWNDTPTACGGNRIEYNHIHHVVDLLGDGASIYTLGNQPGTVIRGNVLHDNLRSKFAPAPWQLAIYLDEGSSHIVTENNLVYRVGTHSFNINGGAYNTTRNNVFGPTLNADQPFIRCHLGRHNATGNLLTGNIIYWDGDVLVDKVWPTDNVRCDSNVYWNFAGKDIDFKGLSFQQWQESGQDPHSVIADPMLMDPKHDDYRVSEKSPALKLGFKPFDPSLAGLQPDYRDLDRSEIAVVRPPVYAMPTAPERETPYGLDLDFEYVPIGRVPMGMSSCGASEDAHIQVSEETAKSGKRCLKFTDKAGLSKNFYPYLTYTRKRETGELHLSFDLKNSVEQPASLTVNVRDYETAKTVKKEFVSGVSLTFSETGLVTADGKELATVPLGEWAHVEIHFGLGETRANTYDLNLTFPNGGTQQYLLPLSDPDFRIFSWLGFIADGQKDAVCYLDNLRFRP